MADVIIKKQRPKNLDLTTIRLPLPGVLSILHRVSGAGLFLFLPVLLCVFGSSLASPEGFADIKAALTNPLAKIIQLGLLWAFAHHFCAGIRYLLLDLHIGVDLESARSSSKVVFAVSLLLTAVLGVTLVW